MEMTNVLSSRSLRYFAWVNMYANVENRAGSQRDEWAILCRCQKRCHTVTEQSGIQPPATIYKHDTIIGEVARFGGAETLWLQSILFCKTQKEASHPQDQNQCPYTLLHSYLSSWSSKLLHNWVSISPAPGSSPLLCLSFLPLPGPGHTARSLQLVIQRAPSTGPQWPRLLVPLGPANIPSPHVCTLRRGTVQVTCCMKPQHHMGPLLVTCVFPTGLFLAWGTRTSQESSVSGTWHPLSPTNIPAPPKPGKGEQCQKGQDFMPSI